MALTATRTAAYIAGQNYISDGFLPGCARSRRCCLGATLAEGHSAATGVVAANCLENLVTFSRLFALALSAASLATAACATDASTDELAGTNGDITVDDAK